MTTPVTLKVRPRVFAKLEAMKRLRVFVGQKAVTWDEFFEILINKSLPFLVLEMYQKMTGAPPKTMEEFSKGLSYTQGFLEGFGISAEQIVDGLVKLGESLPKSKQNKESMYS